MKFACHFTKPKRCEPSAAPTTAAFEMKSCHNEYGEMAKSVVMGLCEG